MDEEQSNQNNQQNTTNGYQRQRKSRRYPGLILIIIGIVFLFINYGYINTVSWGRLWPFFLIIIGVFMLIRRRR